VVVEEEVAVEAEEVEEEVGWRRFAGEEEEGFSH
jgi:hypothetical protein